MSNDNQINIELDEEVDPNQASMIIENDVLILPVDENGDC